MELSYEFFNEIIQYLENEKIFSCSLNDLINIYEKSNFFNLCSLSTDAEGYLIDLLEIILQDKNEWIKYWIYDLDFGHNWCPGKITDNLGNDIKLKTVEDLWVLLQENFNDNI